MRALLIAALLAATLGTTSAAAQTGAPQPGDVAALDNGDGSTTFTLILPAGHVGVTASGDWPVIAVQSGLPGVLAFQVPDPADQNTSESTNLSLNLFDPASRDGQQAAKAFGKPMAVQAPHTESHGAWTIATQGVAANGVPYTVIDAEETGPSGVLILARLAFPHLTGQPGTHAADMRALFLKVLDSVSGDAGTYTVHPGEVVRRPEGQ